MQNIDLFRGPHDGSPVEDREGYVRYWNEDFEYIGKNGEFKKGIFHYIKNKHARLVHF